MDARHRIGDNDFAWDEAKAAANLRKHGSVSRMPQRCFSIHCSC
jgi:hypothetical protein